MSAVDSASAILSTASEAAETPAVPNEVSPADSAASSDSAEATEAVSDTSDGASETNEDGSPKTAPATPTTAAIRAALKAFREASPENAQAVKMLNDGYSRYEAYKEVIPTVEEARTLRATIDSMGGVEGIASLQSIVNNIEETDAMLEAGNPEILNRIMEDAPEGFAKLAGPYLTKLAKANPEAFQAAIQPHFVRGLIDANFPRVVAYLSSKLGDKPELKSIVDDMANWFAEQKSAAEKLNSSSLDPERQKFAKERESFQAEQRKAFEGGISTEMNGHINTELGTRLKPYVASLNTLTPAMRLSVAQACMSELAKALSTDKGYQQQVKAMMDARKPDKSRILSVNKAKVTSLADAVVAKVAKDFGLKTGAAAKPGAKQGVKVEAKGPTGTNLIQLTKAPADADIDWDFPGAKQAFITHRAALKESVAKARGMKSRFVKW